MYVVCRTPPLKLMYRHHHRLHISLPSLEAPIPNKPNQPKPGSACVVRVNFFSSEFPPVFILLMFLMLLLTCRPPHHRGRHLAYEKELEGTVIPLEILTENIMVIIASPNSSIGINMHLASRHVVYKYSRQHECELWCLYL